MDEPAVILWDIGGVLLSNGFDLADRVRAVDQFRLDGPRFETAHERLMDPFERGTLTLDAYLEGVLPVEFPAERRAEVRSFILGCSTAHPDVIAIARRLHAAGRYRMAALNNESRELNDHRIRAFGLGAFLTDFFSSCYTGRRKPDAGAFALALDVLHRDPAVCLFIDDRPENVDAARAVGLRAIQYHTPDRLLDDLASSGVRT